MLLLGQRHLVAAAGAPLLERRCCWPQQRLGHGLPTRQRAAHRSAMSETDACHSMQGWAWLHAAFLHQKLRPQ